MEARYHKWKDVNLTVAEEYLLTDFEDQSSYLSFQFFKDGAINPCMESAYNFVDKIVQEVIRMHEDIQPLKVFHFGGDEVPVRAWTDSPYCDQLMESHPDINETQDFKRYFVFRVADIAHSYGLDLAGWEDGFMDDEHAVYDRDRIPNDEAMAIAWNNVWNLGYGEKAYLLANAGYKVNLNGKM